jgi:type VI secretion system protein ImpM
MEPEQRAVQDSPGWFGKVPMLGDFAHRRLPVDVVTRCDEWLSSCIATSRRELAHDWLDIYLAAPLWCFAWAPRVADASWWFGVLMPSVDGVGRYFPLLICRDAPTPPVRPEALSRLAAWYDAVGQCALSVLEPGATLQSFEARLMAVDGTPAAAADDPPPLTPGADGVRRADPWPGSSSLPDAPAVALRTGLRQMEGHSIWWPCLQDPKGGRLAVVAGLPNPTQYTQMLQGVL